MEKNTKDVLLTLILITPFFLLITKDPGIQVILVAYTSILLYLAINKGFIASSITFPALNQEKNDEVLNNVRNAEQKVQKDITKMIHPEKNKQKRKR